MAINRRFGIPLGPMVVGVLIGLALVAAGCGDGSDGAEDTTTSGVTTASTDPSSTSTTVTPTSTTSTTSTSTSGQPGATTIEVFFSTGDGSDCAQVEGFARPLPDGANGLAGSTPITDCISVRAVPASSTQTQDYACYRIVINSRGTQFAWSYDPETTTYTATQDCWR